MRKRSLLLIVSVWAALAVGSTGRPLTNADIEKLITARIDSSLIIRLIEVGPSAFDTSPSALQKLKDKGAAQDVLDAMAAAKVEARRTARAGSTINSASASLSSESTPNPFPTFAEFSCNVTELSECPLQGCAHDEEHALFNEVKRHVPSGSNAGRLDFQDFAILQADVENIGIELGGEISTADREKLRPLKLSRGRSVGEEDLVQVLGYLVGKPHPNKGESVNCSLHGTANNDIHIPIADDPDKTDFEGIVVEMIPQGRDKHKGWNVSTLNKVKGLRRQILIEGQLFLDNEHVVNEDEEHVIGGQPARMSLWEVHPVTKFLVCNHPGTCNPDLTADWDDIAAFAGNHQ